MVSVLTWKHEMWIPKGISYLKPVLLSDSFFLIWSNMKHQNYNDLLSGFGATCGFFPKNPIKHDYIKPFCFFLHIH